MFEQELKKKLKDIFLLKKVTFDLPSALSVHESDGTKGYEQECLYVQVQTVKSQYKDGLIESRITGTCSMVGPSSSIPYGYFMKMIREAGHEKTKDFFFYEIETNKGIYLNIIERSFRFVFFYNSQYDPDLGTIDDIDIVVTEGE